MVKNMKTCYNCGKVLDDNAVYCDGCGVSTPVNHQPQQQYNQQPPAQQYQYNGGYNAGGYGNPGMGMSPNYMFIKQYYDKMKNAFTVSVVGLIFCMGLIGLGCAIYVLSTVGQGLMPNIMPMTPQETAMVEEAKKKANSAKKLAIISLIIPGALIVLSVLVAVIVPILAAI